MTGVRARLTGGIVALAMLALDQWSKAWVLAQDAAHVLPQEITSYFNLVMVWNKGVSFGLFSRFPGWMPYIITVMSMLLVLVLLVWLVRSREPETAIPLGFIIGGAVGNIIDRFRYGAVTDFIDMHLGAYHWPAFNIGDSAIFIGVVLLLLMGIVRQGKTP